MTDQRPLVFLDTETTGLHADRRPWEIAWIRREIDGTETETVIHISDVDLSNAELQGLKVGRFHERWRGKNLLSQKMVGDLTVLDGVVEGDPVLMPGWRNPDVMPERQAASVIEMDTRDAIIVGAVPNFDTEVLAAMLRRHQLCPAWHYQLVDVETLAAGWLQARPERAPIVAKLNELTARLNEKKVLQAQLHRHASEDSSRRLGIDAQVALDQAIVDEIELELSHLATPPWRSDELSFHCGVRPPSSEERHTALGDARWVKHWYDHITGAGE